MVTAPVVATVVVTATVVATVTATVVVTAMVAPIGGVPGVAAAVAVFRGVAIVAGVVATGVVVAPVPATVVAVRTRMAAAPAVLVICPPACGIAPAARLGAGVASRLVAIPPPQVGWRDGNGHRGLEGEPGPGVQGLEVVRAVLVVGADRALPACIVGGVVLEGAVGRAHVGGDRPPRVGTLGGSRTTPGTSVIRSPAGGDRGTPALAGTAAGRPERRGRHRQHLVGPRQHGGL
ncbi:MAG: hypothetical protein AB7J32_09775 [Pseudonocardia sp.]